VSQVILAGGLVTLVAAVVPLAVAGGTRSSSSACGVTVNVTDHMKYAINAQMQGRIVVD
jgi:hypothetical protein